LHAAQRVYEPAREARAVRLHLWTDADADADGNADADADADAINDDATLSTEKIGSTTGCRIAAGSGSSSWRQRGSPWGVLASSSSTSPGMSRSLLKLRIG
jgi:hypothetical protein